MNNPGIDAIEAPLLHNELKFFFSLGQSTPRSTTTPAPTPPPTPAAPSTPLKPTLGMSLLINQTRLKSALRARPRCAQMESQ